MSTEPNPSVYVALVHETLKLRAFDSLNDLAEEVKARCARLHFVYDTRRVWDAIEHVDRIKKIALATAPLAAQAAATNDRPLTHAESVAVMRDLGLGSLPKPMPAAKVAKIDIYGAPPPEDFSYEVF